jgi:hypothetical protein
MEMVLDSDWLPDNANPTHYWAYYQDVQDTAGVNPALVCGDCINWIEWMKVYIRESDGTQTQLTYADGTDADENILWCVGETSEFQNENKERHQTVTFRFICLGERGKDSETAEVYAPGASEEAVKIMRVNNFTVGAKQCTNIYGFKDELVIETMPQFTPNTYQGLALKQDHMWRILTITVDSETDIFDPYIDITTANTVFPAGNFYAEFTLADGLGTVERWAYDPAYSYILNRRDGRVDADVARDTIEYQIITRCTKTITHP